MNWSYGITCMPERFNDLLPKTVESLKSAGFDDPRLFVDGDEDTLPFDLDITIRSPNIKAFPNWVLSAWELYLRDPRADRYAIFQDDIVVVRNLREYLDRCRFPERGYWNLYTFPFNEGDRGWHLSDQRGMGAVGLVFDNQGLRTLLTAQHMVNRPQSDRVEKRTPQKERSGHVERWTHALDGAIVTAMKKGGYKEYVHSPSLIQHTGRQSVIGNGVQQQSKSFPGEDFDAMQLLNEGSTTLRLEPKPVTIQHVPRRQRVGLVGFNVHSGLGELNRQIATYADIDVWLVRPHSSYKTQDPHPDVETIVCSNGNKLEQFMRRVDVVLFCERPYYPGLLQSAKRHHRRTVCVPMQEWMPEGCRGWPSLVDLFICPTEQAFKEFRHLVPCVHFPWPVDCERFKSQQRIKCERFLFVNGRGGWNGRKGLSVVQGALAIDPVLPIHVTSQARVVGADSHKPSNSELYPTDYDVLIAPHLWDGLGLEPMEAMASGMPVITTDGEPWNEIPALARIPIKRKDRYKVGRTIDRYHPDPTALIRICREWIGQNISQQSVECRQWAEDRSWKLKASEFDRLVQTGEHRINLPFTPISKDELLKVST